MNVSSSAAQEKARQVFPFDLLFHTTMPGEIGDLIRKFGVYCMTPPFPWGHWLYASIFNEVCKPLDGDVIELGVGLGGTSLFLGSLAAPAGKKVYSLDSYEGLPEINKEKDRPYFKQGDYRSTPALADNLFDRFSRIIDQHSLSETVFPIKGFFKESLKEISDDQKYCFVHMDSDLYDSVYDSLAGVYDRVVEGGVIVIDDFFHPAQGPLRAASDFFNIRGLNPIYHVSFPYSVFVFKGEEKEHRNHARSIDGNIYSLEWMRSDAVFYQAVESSLQHAEGNPRCRENCAAFLKLLSSEPESGKDIYTYWKSLEDFWNAIQVRAAEFEQKPIIEI